MVRIDTISYYPGKGNVVTDALSRKERLNNANLTFRIKEGNRKSKVGNKNLSLEGERLYEMLLQPEKLGKKLRDVKRK